MPRFNVQHPVTKKWATFSTICDDYITDWMEEQDYLRWRFEEYGRSAGDLYSANQMSYEEAEERRMFDPTQFEEDEE